MDRKELEKAGLIYPEIPERMNDVPMMPRYQAEEQMMHMSRANRNMMIVIICVCISMVAMAYIFVTGYTARTKDWLNTLAGLQGRPAVTEVQDDGIQQQPGP